MPWSADDAALRGKETAGYHKRTGAHIAPLCAFITRIWRVDVGIDPYGFLIGAVLRDGRPVPYEGIMGAVGGTGNPSPTGM